MFYLLYVWYIMIDRRNQKWIPCDKDHPDAVCKSLTDLPSDKVSCVFVLYVEE